MEKKKKINQERGRKKCVGEWGRVSNTDLARVHCSFVGNVLDIGIAGTVMMGDFGNFMFYPHVGKGVLKQPHYSRQKCSCELIPITNKNCTPL